MGGTNTNDKELERALDNPNHDKGLETAPRLYHLQRGHVFAKDVPWILAGCWKTAVKPWNALG